MGLEGVPQTCPPTVGSLPRAKSFLGMKALELFCNKSKSQYDESSTKGSGWWWRWRSWLHRGPETAETGRDLGAEIEQLQNPKSPPSSSPNSDGAGKFNIMDDNEARHEHR